MVIETKQKTRRKLLVSGAILTLAASGFIAERILKNIMMKNISEMPYEYEMLRNITQRKNKLENSTLQIKNASFGKSFTDYITCENTVFTDCDFEPGSGIRIKALTNVKFERCNFNDTNISGGIWNTVSFTDCTADGEFLILADEGSINLTFNNCHFSGPMAVAGSVHQNHFGAVGSYGNATFNNCTLKYARIIGETLLTVKNSKLTKISASASKKHGNVIFNNVLIDKYISFEEGIFSKFFMKDCEFEFLNLDAVESKTIDLENCKGHLVGKFMVVDELTIRNSIFEANGEKIDPFDNQMAALSIAGSAVKNVTLDGLKFRGSNGTFYLGGMKNVFYDKDDPKSKMVATSEFKSINIHNTPLKDAFIGYIRADELNINNSDIENSDFTNGWFGKITLADLKLIKNVDFSRTRVEEFSKVRLVTESNLNFKNDVDRKIRF
jgi:uncharacterized protein YjbI with pentapeptide repeats